jgi:type VI secretion system protein ImpC
MVRDKVGANMEREELQKYLQKWIMQYVDGAPANSSQTTKAKKPLAAAEIRVVENPEDPGYYDSVFYLRPHYQLEGLTVSLRLVSKLPSEKGV